MKPVHGCDELRPTIDGLAAGRFDALTDDDVLAAEAHLNACAACAARVADGKPPVDDALAPGGRTVRPTAAEWERAWSPIDGAAPRLRLHGVARRPMRVRWAAWSALAAAAAIALAFGTYRWYGKSAPGLGTIQLAGGTDVEIQSVEVGEGETSFVVNVGGPDPAPVVWVVGRREGA